MPKDNNQDPTNPPSNSDDNFPVFVEETLPPMPQEKPIEQPTLEKPEDINVPTVQTPDPVENAILPPIVTSKNKKKSSSGKIIATILGLFLLVGGIGAGVLLVNQNQDIREKADDTTSINSEGSEGPFCVEPSRCTDEHMCPSSCYDVVNLGSCDTPGFVLCDCVSNESCSLPTPPSTPYGDAECDVTCEVDHLGEESYCGGVNDQYWCTNIIGDYGVLKSCLGGTCEYPYTYDVYPNDPNGHCLDTTNGRNCDAGENCSDEPDARCIGPTPTSNPQASCTSVKAYAVDWTYIQPIDLPSLKAGDSVNFCVLGTSSVVGFDKAKVTVNGTSLGETTNKRPSSDDFCSLYTIPEGTNTFNITAEIHHTTLGWK